jgi:hypothetical protein
MIKIMQKEMLNVAVLMHPGRPLVIIAPSCVTWFTNVIWCISSRDSLTGCIPGD